jgi:hypothetical protein
MNIGAVRDAAFYFPDASCIGARKSGKEAKLW